MSGVLFWVDFHISEEVSGEALSAGCDLRNLGRACWRGIGSLPTGRQALVSYPQGGYPVRAKALPLTK